MNRRGLNRSAGRKGVAVLLVLIALAMATILSMSFLNSQGTSLGIARNIEDQAVARAIAESTLDMAVEYIRTNPQDWRYEQNSGVYLTGPTIGPIGNTTICFLDDDSDLSDDDYDAVELIATGLVGMVRHTARATVEVAPGQVGTVLLVVPEAVAEEALRNFHYMDWLRKVFLESWGFTVILIDDDETPAQYNSMIDQIDCAYIAGTANPASVGTKLAAAPIGVVCERGELADELGIASGFDAFVGDDIQVSNNNHYVTKPLDIDRYSLLISSNKLHAISGSMSADLQILAEHPDDGRPMLVVLEAGASTYSGAIVPGRRVFLPWNDDGMFFTFGEITSEAQLIMRRATVWAAKPVLVGEEVGQQMISTWSFEEIAGNIAADSESGHHGQYRFGYVLGQQGRFGNAVRVNGFSGHVKVTHHDDFLIDEGSISMWFNADDPSTPQGIMSKDSFGFDTGGQLLVYFNPPPNLAVQLQSTTDQYTVSSSVPIQPDTWYHMVFTFGSNGMNLYLNGNLVAADPYTGGLSGASSGGLDGNLETMIFGASTAFSANLIEFPLAQFYAGLIDEVSFYNYQLSASEVKSLYSPPQPLQYVVTYQPD